MSENANRRRHERYALPAGYVPVEIRLPGRRTKLRGHAYDISRGGFRFEIDEPLAEGTRVDVEIKLPSKNRTARVRAVADVVWVCDVDDPAPYKMAARFTQFAAGGDEHALSDSLDAGWFAKAA